MFLMRGVRNALFSSVEKLAHDYDVFTMNVTTEARSVDVGNLDI